MKNTWLGILATVAAAVLLTPAAWAQHHGHGGGGHGYGGHAYYGGGHAYYGHGGYGGWEHRGDWDRGWARGWGYPGFYGWGAYPYYGSYPGYYSYDYGPDYYSYAPPVTSYQSFYPPESLNATVTPTAPVSTDEAVVNVRVPDPDAKVWFQGTLTRQTGTDRTYESPPLQPGQSYTYDVRAEWNDNGKTVDQTRHVQVHAGDRVTVDFLAPSANEAR